MHELFEPAGGELAQLVSLIESGNGRCFAVGGAVRDFLLGIEPKDIDIEVHNLTQDELERIFFIQGVHVDLVGKAFGVFKVHIDGETFDFSLPRTERKTGDGHQAFDITVDPFLGINKALSRRDFTINAIAIDVAGRLIDPFGGIQDLISGTLRHVGPAFAEDPLRILRGVQFAARFGFTLAPETAVLCHDLAPELDSISIERVWGEFEKIGLKGKSMAHAVDAILDCKLGQRFGPISFEFGREPDLTGLEGDRRVAVALASILVDPRKIGAPKSVTRMMDELFITITRFQLTKAGVSTLTPQDARFLARELKTVTIRDAFRIIGHQPVGDPRVIDGPLPAFLNGFDVTERGVTGPRVGELLREGTKLQDQGVFVDRVEALDWLDGQTSA